MTEGSFPKSDGDVFYASEANLFKRNSIILYTGNGFDGTLTATAGTTENSVEMTSLTAANLLGATYLKIRALVGIKCKSAAGQEVYVQFKIQTEDLNTLTYSDSFAYQYLGQSGSNIGDISNGGSVVRVVDWIHTLTANEIQYGCKVKLFGKVYSSSNTNPVVEIVNIQTIIYPV